MARKPPHRGQRAHYGGAAFGDASDPVKWWRAKTAQIESGLEEELRATAERGEEEMKRMIETRGTGKRWAHPWGPNRREASIPGRVDTRHMVDSVSSNTTVSERGRVTARFGWLNDTEDYFGYQEGGFKHVFGPEVEGMYAMVDSAEIVFQDFEDNIRGIISGS